MNIVTGEIEWITLSFQVMPPVAYCLEQIKKIAVLGHGHKTHDGTDLDNLSASSQTQRELPSLNSERESIKYNIYGEYTNEENTKIRMEVIFENRPSENLTIIGTLMNRNTSIEGKCYD